MKRDYDYYIDEARKAEQRSGHLWRAINQVIRSVLETQKRKGTPLKDIPGILLEIAGPKRKNESTCIMNLRMAAKQIRDHAEFSVI